MGYRVEYTVEVIKQLKKLDRQIKIFLKTWIEKNLVNCDNPRVHGKALVANKAGLWRYRVGDYRLICRIEDSELVILAMSVGHRRDVYK